MDTFSTWPIDYNILKKEQPSHMLIVSGCHPVSVVGPPLEAYFTSGLYDIYKE